MTSKDKSDDPGYVKSGYLYNLTKFIHYPQNAFNFSMSPFIIGVYGDDSIKSALVNTLRNKQINGREWKIEFYKNPQEIRHCHLIFIIGLSADEAKSLVAFLLNKKILTLADNINGFCEMGGMVNLVGNFPNYGYEISLNALSYAKLSVNPELLDLATIID